MARKKRNDNKPARKINKQMVKRLMLVFVAILILICFLIGRLTYINYTSSDKYKKKVLSQQSYDSVTIPFQRGDIVDSKGTVLATSVAVYNVILDCYVLTSNKEYKEPTIEALLTCFSDVVTREQLLDYYENSSDKRYIVLAKKLPYEQIEAFEKKQKDEKVGSKIKGVWFEKEYQRTYPFASLANSVVGFISGGNVGTTGLEFYYNDTLNGVNGRKYGYLNSDNDFEKTVIEPKNGSTLVTSIDANLQSIVEGKIKEWNEAYANCARLGNGSNNTGVLVMNPNNGEVLAMADYPSFDLNHPRDLTSCFTQEEIDAMDDTTQGEKLNFLWQNFCVNSTVEPGSVQKPLTVACGLEVGAFNENNTFFCDGGEDYGQWIGCVNRSGHGMETVEKAIMDSCNDSLMQMSSMIGIDRFCEYQFNFGFGRKTGIDLPGEASTAPLVRTAEQMTAIDLATNSFGQNYNCTMVQMASAFSSLINGGTLYQPHVVRKVTDSDGNTMSTVDATVLRKTVAKSTSDTIRGYLKSTVSEGGAKYAKVDGYSMGGKTGTGETYPRKNDSYVVSFMGYVPAENPQILIYVVIDQPNWIKQDRSIFAQDLGREILKEALPYLNIYPDEEPTGANADRGVIAVGDDTSQKVTSNPQQ